MRKQLSTTEHHVNLVSEDAYIHQDSRKKCPRLYTIIYQKLEGITRLLILILILILNNTQYNNNNSKLLKLIFFYHYGCLKCIERCMSVIFVDNRFNALGGKQKQSKRKIIGDILVIFILVFPVCF